ncbi:MAG: ParA family protein [Nitriliruptorales bacterium]|nr:ParA family protein [Nitriliruptorales bacterium]
MAGPGAAQPQPLSSDSTHIDGREVPAVTQLRGRLPQPGVTDAQRPASAPPGARVVAVVNQKGGVGKTTTAVSLAAAAAEAGTRVLLVDLDPQGNASSGLGCRVAEGEPSTYHVLVHEADPASITRKTSIPGLQLWGGSLDLAGAEIELVAAFNREHQLRLALDSLPADVDLVIVDCPPSLGLLTINALVAADRVLVPIQCEYYALEGLQQLHRLVSRVQRTLNPALELGGIVLTMFDRRTNLARDVVSEVATHYPDVTFQTIIPRTVRLSEAPSYGHPITVFDPEGVGSAAYRALAREFLDRENLPVAPDGPAADPGFPTVSSVLAPPAAASPDPSAAPISDGDAVSPWLRVGSTTSSNEPTGGIP